MAAEATAEAVAIEAMAVVAATAVAEAVGEIAIVAAVGAEVGADATDFPYSLKDSNDLIGQAHIAPGQFRLRRVFPLIG